VLALNEGDYVRRTVDSLCATVPENAEILVVDDGSTDGCCDFLATAPRPNVRLLRGAQLGVSKGRNFGARHARGEHLIFSDAHVETPEGWWQPIVDALALPGAGASTPTLIDIVDRDCRGYGLQFTGPDIGFNWLDIESDDPYPAPLLTGAFWAIRRDVFDATGGFDEGMIRWGSEDTEYSLRLWLLGYVLYMVPGVEVAHLFREKGDYTVEWSWVLHNRLRLAYLHFNDERFGRVCQTLSNTRKYAEALDLLRSSDACDTRARLRATRTHDDEWYFAKFPPAW
jgi:GT2 family glycosyltransferase